MKPTAWRAKHQPAPVGIACAMAVRAESSSTTWATLSTAIGDGSVNVPIMLEVVKSAAGRWIEGAEFVFERGRVTLTLPSPMAVESVAQVVLDDSARTAIAQAMPTGAGWCFARQAVGFIDALTGGGAPMTTGAQGLEDMILIEQMWRRIAGRP